MKRVVIILIQALVTGALLWWIFHKPEKREMMAAALKTAEWGWFIPILLATGAAVLLQTWRWKLLLAVQGIHPTFRRVQALNMIGLFFNMFLPGSTGGDLLKIYFTIREAPEKKMPALLSVVLDRVMGLLALIAIAAVISILAFPLLWDNTTTRGLLITLGVICGGSLAVIAGGVIVEVFQLADRIPHWMPLRRPILELASAFSTYAKSPLTLLAAFALSLPVHLLLFSSYFFAACAFGAGLSLTQLFTVLPIVLTIASLPISLAGLGVREELFQITLGALFGTLAGMGALIGFSGFLGLAFWAAIGGVIYIFYRPTDKHHPVAEAEQMVEKLEQEIDPGS